MVDNTIIIFISFVVGTVFGSFVTLASYRLPLAQDIALKPSHCPKCNHPLHWHDLFPVLSWLFNRGRCHYCKAPVSLRYPLIELSLGAIFAGLAWRFGLAAHSFFLAMLAIQLMILIVIDLEHLIIPDRLQIALCVTGIVYAIYRNADMEDVTISVLAGAAIGLSLHYGYLWLRRTDALGWGDVKFLAVAGAWIPLINFIPFLFLSGIIGTLTGLLWRMQGKGAIFPFGPALACSLFINTLFPDILSRIIL